MKLNYLKLIENEDNFFMDRALNLSLEGLGNVYPNPLVGAVIVKDNKIIAEGFHRKYGDIHAEAMAIKNAREKNLNLKGASLYLTLEPCNFEGSGKINPPCAPLIYNSGISKVFIANFDQNPKTFKKGFNYLQDKGIEVITNLGSKKANLLNERFFKYSKEKIPFIHLKIATSLDSKIATKYNESKWISSKSSRQITHEMRALSDCILVGIETVIRDDPSLNIRIPDYKGREILKIVLDSKLRIPLESKLIKNFKDSLLIFASEKNKNSKNAKILQDLGVSLEFVSEKNNCLNLSDVIEAISKRSKVSLFVEGGASVFSSFLKEGLYDKISLFLSPIIIGEGISAIKNISIDKLKDAIAFKDLKIFSKGLEGDTLLEIYKKN